MNWQPIETAPKDGDPVLFYEPPQIGLHNGRIMSGCMECSVPCDERGYRVLATHWMPLPDPPKEGE